MYPHDLERIINFYKKLPGVGEKTAERLALSTIGFSYEELSDFADTIKLAKNNLVRCSVCGHLTDQEKCSICFDEKRNKKLICVLEDFRSVFAFEKNNVYNGTYHVLNGLISPIDQVSPDDINISSLIKRCEELGECELILALSSCIEGETTMLYISKICAGKNIQVSRLSYGIPLGADIEYIDSSTLDRALEDRKKIS